MDTDGNIRSLLSLLPQSLLAVNAKATGGGLIGLLLLFIIFVILGGYFGASESGFSAMNKIRIKAKAEDGNPRAKHALFIHNNFDRALTTLLIGNNVTHIAAASVATLIATRLYGASNTVTAICTVVTTLIIFLFSEMIPKSFANDRSETMALFAAPSLRFLMKILYPLASFFTLISKACNKITSHFVKSESSPTVTEEELYDIIDTIEEEGVMNEEQGDLFKSALDFSETRAKDVMTMRADICAVDISLSNEEIIRLIQSTSHSRLPVYEGDIDHIVGTLQIRIFIREYLKNPQVNVRSLLLPPYVVSPNAMIDDLLSEMRQHKFYLGVVNDNEGKTMGVITIEDFLEELVGEIYDEDDVVDKDFTKLGGNRFLVNAKLTFGDACERMKVPCPAPKYFSRPIISFLLEYFGRIPEEEETLTLKNLEITVDTVESGKVLSVVIFVMTEELAKVALPEEGGNLS